MMKLTMRAAVGIAIPAFQLTAIVYPSFTDAGVTLRCSVNGGEEQVWTRPPR